MYATAHFATDVRKKISGNCMGCKMWFHLQLKLNTVLWSCSDIYLHMITKPWSLFQTRCNTVTSSMERHCSADSTPAVFSGMRLELRCPQKSLFGVALWCCWVLQQRNCPYPPFPDEIRRYSLYPESQCPSSIYVRRMMSRSSARKERLQDLANLRHRIFPSAFAKPFLSIVFLWSSVVWFRDSVSLALDYRHIGDYILVSGI